MRRAILALMLYVTAVATFDARADEDVVVFTKPVSTLKVAADEIGPNWSGPTGLVLDDLSDVSDQPPKTRRLAEELSKQLSPIGVVGAADFTYQKESTRPVQVTVRIFVFDSVDACQKWWVKKYRVDGWEKLYTPVTGLSYKAADSKEMKKRAASVANVWITSGSALEDGDHLQVLNLYIQKLMDSTRKK